MAKHEFADPVPGRMSDRTVAHSFGTMSVPMRTYDVPDASALPRMRALMTMPCAAVGVGMTCRSLLGAAGAAGYRVDLWTSRFDPGYAPPIEVREAVRSIFRRVPYSLQAKGLERRLHAAYLADLGPGDIAYLWPSVPLSVYEDLHRRGVRIVAEAINTRMAVARPILDAAYSALGLPPQHGITDERIAEQAAKHALCAAIFAPSPATEASFAGTLPEQRIIPSSYGTWIAPARAAQRLPGARPGPVRFLFVGLQSVRKGLPALLTAWRDMPQTAELVIVGEIEPAVAEIFSATLALPNVVVRGFTRDVGATYRDADVFVFPSLEEGDPIVTYEAAAHGLAIVATAVGAGRIGAQTGCVSVVPPQAPDVLGDRLRRLAASAELRAEWGALARAAVAQYDWSLVGPRSLAALHARFARTGEPA